MDEKADQSAPAGDTPGTADVVMIPLLEAGRQIGLGRAATYAAYHKGDIPGHRFGKQIQVAVRWVERMASV